MRSIARRRKRRRPAAGPSRSTSPATSRSRLARERGVTVGEQTRLVGVLHEEVGGGLREPEHLDRDRCDDRTLEDLARGRLFAHALPRGARQHGVRSVCQRSLEVHADGASGPSGPSSAAGCRCQRPGAERAGGGVADLRRTHLALHADREAVLMQAPELLDLLVGAIGAQFVPVVVAIGLVDLAPQRREPRALGDDLGVEALVVGEKILLAVGGDPLLFAQPDPKGPFRAGVVGAREHGDEGIECGVQLGDLRGDPRGVGRVRARAGRRRGDVDRSADRDRERRRFLGSAGPDRGSPVRRGDRARGRRVTDVRGRARDRGDPVHAPSTRAALPQTRALCHIRHTFVEREVVIGRQEGGGAEALDHLRHVRRRREPGQRQGRVRHRPGGRHAEGGEVLAGIGTDDPDPDAPSETFPREIDPDRRGRARRRHGEPRDGHLGLEGAQALHQQARRGVRAGVQRHRTGDHHRVERGGELLLADGPERPERLVRPGDRLRDPARLGVATRACRSAVPGPASVGRARPAAPLR